MAKDLKLKNIFKFLLIFYILFAFSLNYDIIEYSYLDFINEDTIYAENVNGGLTYKISYEKGEITQNYLRITTIPDFGESLYLYYSPISEKREDAFLLNYGNEEISLYINKAFTKSEADGIIYLTFACFSSECSFEFSILEINEIDLSRNGQYTYITTDKKNTKNNFKIFRADYENEEGFLTFWATGSKDIQMDVKYVDEANEIETNIKVSQLENGKYSFIKENDYPVNYEENSSLAYFIIEVISPGNSLITVGSNLNLLFNNDKPNIYNANSKEIYGILNNNCPKQCFDFGIDSSEKLNYFLHVLDFQRNINIEVIDKNGDKITNYEILNGKILITITNQNADNYYCLTRKNIDNLEASFSLQVTYDIEKNYYKSIYSPQINGFSYERFLKSGQFAYYTGLSSLKYKTELRYYVKIKSGYPIMYFVKCKNFPHCEFDLNNLPSDTIKPNKINDIYSYSIYKTEITNSISPEQYVLLVFCSIEQSCSFETNFYNDLDYFVLPKEEKIYQTIMIEGKNNFVIKLDGENNYKQIFVDFLTYSGDISIKYEAEGFFVREYLAGNKKYFVLDKKNNENINEIYFYIKGEMASYYSVDYKLIINDTNKINMKEESGINYLETIEPKFGYKTISLYNSRLDDKRSFLVNFYSLNCELLITRKINEKEKKLQIFDYLSQDIISNTDEDYNNEKYDYYMEIVKMDNVTKFNTNYCMVYVSSIENNLDNENDYQKRQLLISEGVINRIILNKSFPKIEYIYPHINPYGYVIINLNMGTNSKINIKISIDNKIYKEITTGKSQYIIIEESVLHSKEYCPILNTRPNQICNIIIEISLDSKFYEEEPIIELNIKSKEDIPSFIRKSMIRRDVIVGNYYQYFYTEIGKKEMGNININFDYNEGNVYGRIVNKNLDEGSGWMNKYILPNENNNELKYDYYTKKIYFNLENTEKCDYGCYLIIKVEPNFSIDYYKSENIAYPLTLSINSNDGSISDFNSINSVDIPINEYILGDTVPISNKFNDFYTFWIPYDCEEIIFEFIGDSTYIFINVGSKKPTFEKSDFQLNEIGIDNILRITKNEIINKMNTTTDTIKNVQLTFAVGANYIDNKNSSLYYFRLRSLIKDEIELIPLTSNYKTLCDIKGKNGNCNFILPYLREVDEQNNFFFHVLEIPNIYFNYYAYEVDKDIITNRDNAKIKEIIENKEKSKWSSENSRGNYLYIDNSEITDKENGVYILLNIEIKAPTKGENDKSTISLLHSVYSYNGIILPNPSTSQLYIVNNNNYNDLILDFSPNNENLKINIKSISGKGKIYWDLSDDIQINNNKNINSDDENTYYYLNNPGELLSLTIGNSEILPLHFINTNPDPSKKDSNDKPGFGFYIYFERESQNQNYHNINYGQSNLISFKDADFPFIFYSRLPDKLHEVDIDIKLDSLKSKSSYSVDYLKNENIEEEIPLYDEFIINGLVLNESFIYDKKSKENYFPDSNTKPINGIYDPSNKIFKMQFTPKIINDYNINGNNYLYINITKGNNNKIYTEATIECNIFPSNHDGYYIDMNKYINGKIPYEQNGYIRYELSRINGLYNYMRFEFSANYEKIDFSLNLHKLNDDISKIDFYKNNTDFIYNEFYNGKIVLIIQFTSDDIKSVYLSIFNTEHSHVNKEKKLSNFIFKYEVKEKNDFNKIRPESNEISNFNYNRGVINITLPNIKSEISLSKINYYVKLIPSDEIIDDENIYTISLIESKPIKIYSKLKEDVILNEELELIDIHNDKIYYIVINCEIFDKENNEEKFGFKYIYNPTDYKNEKGKVSLAVVMIVIIVFAFLAIAFVILFLYLKRTNLRKTIQLKELNQKLNENNILDKDI